MNIYIVVQIEMLPSARSLVDLIFFVRLQLFTTEEAHYKIDMKLNKIWRNIFSNSCLSHSFDRLLFLT